MSEEKYVIDDTKFKAARKRAKCSVRALAEKCNVSVSLIEKYEKGGAKIVESDLELYLKLFDVKREDIIVLNTPAVLQSLSGRWKLLLRCVAERFEVSTAYAHFFDCVEWYCAPHWEVFCEKRETAEDGQGNSHNTVYTFARKNNFKKNDVERLKAIEHALWLYSLERQEYAFELLEQDGHIFEFFVRQLPKVKEIITAIKKQAEEMEEQTFSVDIEKLDKLYGHITFVEKEAAAIDEAEKRKLDGGVFTADDFGGNSDITSYYEDVISDLDVRLTSQNEALTQKAADDN